MLVTVVKESMVGKCPITDSGVMVLKRFVEEFEKFPVTSKSTIDCRARLRREDLAKCPDLLGYLDRFEFVLNDNCTYTVTARFKPVNPNVKRERRFWYTSELLPNTVNIVNLITGVHLP